MLRGFILPHAPVLLFDRGYPEVVASAHRIRAAARALPVGETDRIVIISPHGSSSAVLSTAGGTLDEFGSRGYSIRRPVDAVAAEELAVAWGCPLVDRMADHGVVVSALLLGQPHVPVVCVTLTEATVAATSPAEAIDDSRSLAKALKETFAGTQTVIVLSGHTSAALSPRAPLLDRPAGHLIHDAILRALRSDISALGDIDEPAWAEAGSCGAGPFTVAADLWAGQTGQLRAEETATGVGHIVAVITGRPGA
jgi:aromatic ring-opening dioxygenase LigB subunit